MPVAVISLSCPLRLVCNVKNTTQREIVGSQSVFSVITPRLLAVKVRENEETSCKITREEKVLDLDAFIEVKLMDSVP